MTRLEKILDLLAKRLRYARAHRQPDKARRARAAQDDLTPPVVIIFPGVRAARAQSRSGGFPGIGGPNPGAGWCLKMVRLCYGIAAVAEDATAAWVMAKRKHRTTDPESIPRGYPVFWLGGSSGHGHVAISAGNGMCWSTDIKRSGFFDLVSIASIHDAWGLTLVGWTGDLNGAEVPAEKAL